MVWWWIGNVVLAFAVIPLVVFLAHRVLKDADEVSAYAADTLEHGLGITRNVDPVPALAETAGLVRAARDAAAAYAGNVARLLRGGA